MSNNAPPKRALRRLAKWTIRSIGDLVKSTETKLKRNDLDCLLILDAPSISTLCRELLKTKQQEPLIQQLKTQIATFTVTDNLSTLSLVALEARRKKDYETVVQKIHEIQSVLTLEYQAAQRNTQKIDA